jgi:hypothetical protein
MKGSVERPFSSFPVSSSIRIQDSNTRYICSLILQNPVPIASHLFEPCFDSSAYKECATCQTDRLAIDTAIRERNPPSVIRSLQQKFSQHLQGMLSQRAVLEQITQFAHHESFIVCNSDKCGDGCLHAPCGPGNRVSSSNVGLYRFKLALQADVFASKLFHLTLLLPNLKGGADFGITAYFTGLVRLAKLGMLGGDKSKFMRGFDGDSGNVCAVGLAFNCTLIHHRRANVMQQHRLPPDHSHTWHTDGLFSVIEGWLTHEGFRGAYTISQLVSFLRTQFSQSPAYHDQTIEISILIANFAFTKWLDDCIDKKPLRNIGVPLVWRHTWEPSTQTVCSQYKLDLAAKRIVTKELEKDEWGPWIESWVDATDPATGMVYRKKKLTSDPKGVVIMKRYPAIADDPGLELWMEPDDFEREKVFSNLKRYKCATGTDDDQTAALSEWEQLHQWMKAHPTSDSITLSNPISLGHARLQTTPTTSWADAWAAIPVIGSTSTASAGGVTATADVSRAVGAQQRMRAPDRDSLALADSAALLNVVEHSGYTGAERQAALAADPGVGQAYLHASIEKKGELLLIELEHFEGVWKVGLGRRTFNDDLDTRERVEIEWYRLKASKARSGRVSHRTNPLPHLFIANSLPHLFIAFTHFVFASLM